MRRPLFRYLRHGVPITLRIAINCQIWRWPVHRDLLLVKLCLLPVGLAVMITWVCFRNDSRIGWPLQSVIGIIFVAWILSCNVPCPSLKLITSIFALFVLYDVFFVFITPYFTSHHSRTVEPSSVAAQGSLRLPRSTDLQESYMEAIATGSAGKSGENLPASFRFRVLLPSGVFGCSTHEYGMLLGYGDAVFPGLLSAYLALFDSVWHIRFRRNYLASLFGTVSTDS
ncbi:unnamed protein product [Dicrocoelium dendriticum]|nr:unnamed protein product [Dicrocoelium dendriticum]